MHLFSRRTGQDRAVLELDTGRATPGQGCTSAFQLHCHGPGQAWTTCALCRAFTTNTFPRDNWELPLPLSCLLGAQDCTELVQSPKEIRASDIVAAARCWQMKILGRFSIPSLSFSRAPLHRLCAFCNPNHPGTAPNEGSTKVAKKKPQTFKSK